MTERKPTITIKKRRRAIKFWDHQHLHSVLQDAVSVRAAIEEAQDNSEEELQEMAPFLVSAEVLWNLTDSYIYAYDKLLKESLISSGNSIKISNELH